MRPKMDDGYDGVGVSMPLPGVYSDVPAPSMREHGTALPLATVVAHNQELLAELNRLRAERDRWMAQQREILALLASKSPDRILHDLRNVLNQRELFRSLADLGD